ncbi:hypothetical protein ACHAO1_011257, partial [Botrytis cinerea]
MQNNDTSLHFHGIRQKFTNYMDGIASATQYGSSWYYSHFYVQAWIGLMGGIVINGPATANYDKDLENLFLNDCSHQTADDLAIDAAASGPPTLDNCLINGTNTWTEDDRIAFGSRFETTFDSGARYRVCLVNGVADTHFRFMIDNHTLEIIAAGFHYDIVVIATEETDNSWLRGIPLESCSENDNFDNILGIVRYDSTSIDDPTTSTYAFTDSCNDEAIGTVVPYLALATSTADFEDDEAVTLSKVDNTIFWYRAGTSFVGLSDPFEDRIHTQFYKLQK